MISVSPLSGYKNITQFTFQNSITASDVFVNWSDQSFSYTNTATHIYNDIGIYSVYGGSCSSTSAFSVSVYNGDFFTNKISVEREAVSSLVSTYYPFTINLSSLNEKNTVILYASGSSSIPYKTDRNFWSHLNPEWEFIFNNEQISELEITGSPVYSGSNILGYSASSAIHFKDDMPGNPVLFFTVLNKEYDIPTNSRVFEAFSHSICAVTPDKLFITSDGIEPINSLQWADSNIPYVISVGSSTLTSTNILHYVSGNITGIKFQSGCYGSSLSAVQYNLNSINLFDDQCFPTGGYILSSLYYPSSALPSASITNNLEECNFNFDKIEYNITRKTPKNVVLSATGVFSYNNETYNLTGTSNAFDILAFENRHSFYRKGEDYTIYDILKTSLPFDVEQFPNFNVYLSAIAGEGDTLGKSYDKIKNFNLDHSDIDLCNYDVLINKAQQLDSEIDDFGLEFPEELKRVFNFATIPLQKLIGTRCVCNTNFENCKNCENTNVCKICKFDKRSNLGNQLSLTDYITAGETILYKETANKNYNFLVVPSQDSDVYQIKNLSSEPVYSKGLNNFCFYSWNKTPQNNPIESVVNYHDSRNLLNPNLSSNNDWYSDNGIVEEMFNYILTKNLIDS